MVTRQNAIDVLVSTVERAANGGDGFPIIRHGDGSDYPGRLRAFAMRLATIRGLTVDAMELIAETIRLAWTCGFIAGEPKNSDGASLPPIPDHDLGCVD